MKIIADHNIAHLHDFFNTNTLGQKVELLTLAGRKINADALAKFRPDALLIRSVTPINEQLLINNPWVKFIGTATIGIDHVDTAYLAQHNIRFANASGCSKHSVVQYVLTAILNTHPDYLFEPITIGIVGLGNIGGLLANYAKLLGWQVLGVDPFLANSNHFHNNNPQNYQQNLDKLLSQSDVISLHVPLTHANDSPYPTDYGHLMTSENWQKIKPYALMVNCARGEVLSRADILANPQKVVLDVFEHEPKIDKALLQRCHLATPHIAGYTLEGKLRGTQMIYDALCNGLQQPPKVDFKQFLPNETPLFSKEFAQRFHQLQPLNQYDKQVLLENLNKIYPIYQDDAKLRLMANPDVIGKDFDQLRKDYPLRREWQAYFA
ncbi:D-isomer specific 2-hydroxyacid dehydrogenase [Moraxella macacae 0408225]|uniref:Erythronate-4-phosphate dehydrogenase n=1 Tax=Moraxella macacae 0408225 TaxID=1230338 RepID=L2F4Q9_9GAMM|nr:4-phosphoerythronate dehydrogenase [Moraxella macacae]ELA08019.1 D-isomer specific 2-hydroxyacid dehydrogenase [Moraxella macacae 0408225]